MILVDLFHIFYSRNQKNEGDKKKKKRIFRYQLNFTRHTETGNVSLFFSDIAEKVTKLNYNIGDNDERGSS